MGLISNFLFRYKFQTILVVIVFYAVGVAGIEIESTQHFFISLIPFALLLSFILIAFSHHPLNTKGDFIILGTVFFLSYLIEVVGVSTHFPFGSYSYGHGLGFKVLGTPFMIGINWLMLVYCSASILELTGWSKMMQVFMASILMVLYDVVLEHVAPLLDMWNWKGNTIPLQNYLAWFMIALGFHGLIKWKKVSTVNWVAPAIFICQFLFFIAILIFK